MMASIISLSSNLLFLDVEKIVRECGIQIGQNGTVRVPSHLFIPIRISSSRCNPELLAVCTTIQLILNWIIYVVLQTKYPLQYPNFLPT